MAEETVKPAGGKRRKIIFVILFLGTLVIALGGYHFYSKFKTYVSTDNAYVKEDFTIIAPRVGGTIVGILVTENKHVKKGELIAEIDPRDYKVKVSQAEMAVIMARNQVGELYGKMREAEADMSGKKASLDKAKLDFDRAKTLYSKQVIPKDQMEKAETYYKVAVAQYEAAVNQKERTRAAIGEKIKGEEAIVRHNEEILKEALQYLEYTKIFAPQDGYIARKTVETGNVVSPGQPLMALVPMRNPYIEANFKETEVGRIKLGDKAEIKLDIYPDKKIEGVVESISVGTGVTFSLLPPENATGNWIKVVQRVPVKIKITSDLKDVLLRLGLSCEVKVKIQK